MRHLARTIRCRRVLRIERFFVFCFAALGCKQSPPFTPAVIAAEISAGPSSSAAEPPPGFDVTIGKPEVVLSASQRTALSVRMFPDGSAFPFWDGHRLFLFA